MCMGKENKMHIAFISIGALGHVLAALPVCRELQQRGHRISFFSAEFIRPQAEPFGVDFYAVDSSITKGGKGDENASENVEAELPLRFLKEAEAGVGSIVKVLENDRPDLILNDTLALSGRLAAAYLNVPRIQFFTSVAANEHFHPAMFWPKELEETEPRKQALALAKELQNKYGGKLLTSEEIFGGYGDFNIVTIDKKFQPAAESFGDNFFFAGPQIAERTGEASWNAPGKDRRKIYVSLGTVFNNNPGFWRIVFDAVKDLNADIICSIGNILKKEELGKIPGNVYLYEFLPQLKVLRLADGFISHAGIGSVMEAAWFGVPILAVPQMVEQRIVAEKVKELQIGDAILEPDELTSERIRKGILDLLENQDYRNRIWPIQNVMHETEGPEFAADAVLEYFEKIQN